MKKFTASVAARFRAYRKRPMSLIMFLSVMLAAFATFVVLIYLIGYILVMGIPHLSWDLSLIHI